MRTGRDRATPLGLTRAPANLDSHEDLFSLDLAALSVPSNLGDGHVLCRRSQARDLASLTVWRKDYEDALFDPPDHRRDHAGAIEHQGRVPHRGTRRIKGRVIATQPHRNFRRYDATAARQMRSHNSGKLMPAACADCGNKLVRVMPGTVFTSRHHACPASSSRKSTRL